jgi:hypothetical protein
MDDILRCRECNRYYKHLGSHIWHRHKMLARDYKTKFGLPWKMGLVTPDIAHKQSVANRKHKAIRRRNFLKGGVRNRFKKGHTGQRRISEHERINIMKRILDVNKRKKKLQRCPVCRMQFNHMESHLYQKHKLINVRGLQMKGLE